MTEKLFTPADANRTLPLVKRIVAGAPGPEVPSATIAPAAVFPA